MAFKRGLLCISGKVKVIQIRNLGRPCTEDDPFESGMRGYARDLCDSNSFYLYKECKKRWITSRPKVEEDEEEDEITNRDE